MVSLLGVGCGAFLAVGLVDQRACDTLKAQEASLDLLTWLKLLFVPTLAIVILILFLLEEYCYAHEQDATNHNNNMPHNQQALHAHAHSSPSSSSGPSKALLQGGAVGTGGGGTGGELQGAASSLLRKASGGRGDVSALVSQEKRLRSPSGAAGSGATSTSHQAATTAAGGDAQPFPHPLTLLSPSRTTPGPSPAYPHLTLASGTAEGLQLQGDALSAAAQYVGFNPQAILAGDERTVRQQVIQQGLHQAQQAQIALMGHPASLAMTAAQQPGAFRINLMNEAGVSCILVVHATTTLREVFAWYAAKNNAACWINSSHASSSSSSSSSSAAASGTSPSMHHSLYRFRLQGTLLTNEKATLGSLGLPYAPAAAAAAAAPPKDTSVAVKEKAKDKAATAAAKEKAASTTAMTPAVSTATAASAAAGSDASSSSSAKDCCLIQVELDWERLYHQLQHETLKDAEHLVELKAIELEALAGEQEKTRELEEKVTGEKKRERDVHDLLEAAATAKVEHQAKIDAAKAALSSESTRVLSARKEKLEAEGSDAERVEFKRLDKTVQALKRDLDALNADVAEINGKRTRLENERAQLTRETTIVREKTLGMEEEEVKLAMYAVHEDGTSAATSSSASTVPLPGDFLPLSSLNSSLEALERTFEDLKLQRKKVDFITQEIAHKKAEVHALAKKVHMSAGLTAAAANNTTGEDMGAGGAGTTVGGSMPPVPLSGGGGGGGGGSKLDALPHLRSRAAQLEAQTKDLLRWKSVAKHLELEAKEAFRWQSLLRAAVQRERATASPTTTTTTSSNSSAATAAATVPSNGPSAEQIAISTWRARARAFSREATALRAYKRSILAGGGGSGGADGGSGAQGGDFYSSASEAAAADAGFGLGMNAKWESMMDSHFATGADGSGGGDLSSSMLLHAPEEEDAEPEDPSLRIEPLPMHARAAEAEEAERQAALLQSGATSTASSAAASTASTAAASAEIMGGPSDRLSEELLAAEQEEERLLASMASNRGYDGDQISAGGSGPASPSRRSISPSSAAAGASGSAAQGGVDHSSAAAEEELFRLGEALVRRNQHLHQHRLMVRYQQQQQHQQHQQASLQQHGGMRVSDGSMDFLPGTTNSGSGQSSMQQQQQQQYSRDPSSSSGSSASSGSMLLQQQSSSSSSEPQQHSYSNAKASLTGILQATAPVFTPRYQTDAPSVMPLGGHPSPVRQSHYTRVTSGGGGGTSGAANSAGFGGSGGLATSPQLAALTATTSPSNSTLSWSPAHAHNQSDNFPTSSGTSGSSSMSGHSHHGPSSLEASWNSSLQSLLDDMDSSAGHHHPMSSLTSHSHSGVHRSSAMVGVGRDRSYSNPSAPNALPPLAAHHAPVAHQQQFGGLSSLSGGIGTSLNSGLSSGGLGSSLNAHDPFTAFRRQANPHGGGGLAIIDDADHATSFDHTNGFADPLAMGQPINLQQYRHPFSARGASTSSTTPLGSASLSRVHSGASSPSQQLFASSAGGGLPPFFALNNQK